MRAAIWLYLDLLARLPSGADSFEAEPAAIGLDMGLPEGTVRSWLGHFDEHRHLAVQNVSWYWHFVDVVWIFIYLILYWTPHWYGPHA